MDENSNEMATLEPLESLYKDDELTWDAIFKTRSVKLPKHKGRKEPNFDDMMLGDDPRVHGADTTIDNEMYDGEDSDMDDLDKRGGGDGDHKGKHKGRGNRRKNNKKGRKNRKNKNKQSKVPTGLPNELADSATVSNPDPDGNEETSNYIYEETKAPPIKFRTCLDLRCHAAGRCVPDEMRGGVRCQCRLGNTGEFCEQGKWYSHSSRSLILKRRKGTIHQLLFVMSGIIMGTTYVWLDTCRPIA